MTKQSGFTLIELMVVVAVIGVLSAIAIPQYQNYVARAQVAEGFSLVSSGKMAVAEYYNENGSFPTDNATARLGAANTIIGKYVGSVTVGNAGALTVAYNTTTAHEKLQGKNFVLTPTDNGGSISWACGVGTVGVDYLPNSCQ